MSRTLRKQILSMVDLLEKANRTLKASLSVKHINQGGILQLLCGCQETAIGIGCELEALYGEGTASVQKLEEYCENLYEMTLVLGDSEKHHDILKALAGQVKQARKLIGEQIPDRMEAVFFPYKASMWDSLESVWMAAEEDGDCEAYVVPIPYYDRSPDGTFTTYHYEGNEMPDYVSVTYYEDYAEQIRRPDIVFIHNPYDQCNYVTSVEPRFYARELKKCTDCLVYIPYFTLGETEPSNKEAVKGMAHFCTVPGVIYADKVIVQSEKMRQVYINVLSEQYGEKTRSKWKNKILGLGSPKYDKVQSTRKDDLELPDEWLHILSKPDGSRKKVILYNTSVSALLQFEERMLKKMRLVFQIFQDARDDIALLWRPHPLIKATINSMRPRLRGEYRDVVEEYRAAGWGIYDDSPELERAIALCDGYYGDYSSLVQLCQEAGKPIMIQNVDL